MGQQMDARLTRLEAQATTMVAILRTIEAGQAQTLGPALAV